jgi:putative Holliday junction resolvase
MTTYLALDPGEKTVGVAVSDATGTLARPLAPLNRRPHARFLRDVSDLLASEGAEALVVGLPLRDGRAGPKAQAAMALAHELRKAANVPVATQDEAFTTVEAWEIMRANGAKGARAAGKADGVAAALILEGYLRRGSPPGRCAGAPKGRDAVSEAGGDAVPAPGGEGR